METFIIVIAICAVLSVSGMALCEIIPYVLHQKRLRKKIKACKIGDIYAGFYKLNNEDPFEEGIYMEFKIIAISGKYCKFIDKQGRIKSSTIRYIVDYLNKVR